ncbi:glycosyltransferase [Rhodopirellula sp. P2]|uniref:glycosyltransferase n=1 Tax=Rhodopirellula sp. P2 TaxID=2127060 RepID=UPI0023674F0E|nr:glycosyltransferase [Rhodopirellula sp. P2]WDQ15659.1 glycosyltransferase [Rhodopirellula sp. P2]
MIRVVHTIAGTRQTHGGTSRSVPSLCNALAKTKAEVHLICGVPVDANEPCNLPDQSVQLHAVPESQLFGRKLLGFGFSRCLDRIHTTSKTHGNVVIHDHGLWLSTNHAVAKQASDQSIARIVSPRGMLSEWSLNRRRFPKSVMWRLYQHRDLSSATGFHATCAAEANAIRALGFQQPIAVISNGVTFSEDRLTRKPKPIKQLLFLSRIHPVKGLVPLIKAFQRATIPDDWSLLIAGPDEGGHRAEVTRLIAKLDLQNRVTFEGPVDDQKKWLLMQSSDLFVLPSFTENFGICVAEAMAAGLPVITTTGTPWQLLADQRMGWWVDPEPQAIAKALGEACNLSDSERNAMGQFASKFARDQFGWEAIAEQMATFYRWILGDRTTTPDFILN